MTDSEIRKVYEMIRAMHSENLKKHGVKLPRLITRSGNYTKDALVLVYLSRNYPRNKKVSKVELTEFIRKFYPATPDVQSARHLASQKGWYIISGARGNMEEDLGRGEYRLVSLKEPYPGFVARRRVPREEWEAIKAKYDYRCATCGSKEGKESFHWKGSITRLQRAHRDPGRPLTGKNIIPQCEKCNRADRNYWAYDRRGRVIKLSDPRAIKKSDRKVRWEVYRILYEEFQGVDPREPKG